MWILLQALGGLLLGGLVRIIPTLVGQVLIGLGISVITYAGVSTTIGWLQDQAISSFSGLGSTIIGLLAVMKVGTCISMIASATLVRLTLGGLTGGGFKRFVKQ